MFPEFEFVQTPKSNYSYGSESYNGWGVARNITDIAVHWWGCNCDATGHQGVISTFTNPSRAGSTHFIVSDNRITQMVAIEDIAWTTNGCNPVTVSIEHQPNMNAQGYRNSGLVVYSVEKRLGIRLDLIPHNQCWSTQCPGNTSLDRIRQEADALHNAGNVAPQVPEWKKNLVDVADYSVWVTSNQAPVTDINNNGNLKMLDKNTNVQIGGTTTVGGIIYLVSVYAMSKGLSNGIREDLTTTTDPTVVAVPALPEWKQNLSEFSSTSYWFTKDEVLRDLCNNGAPTSELSFTKNAKFVAKGRTSIGGVQYVVTQFSLTKDRCRGVPVSSLSITDPTIVVTPPVLIAPHPAPNVEGIVVPMVVVEPSVATSTVTVVRESVLIKIIKKILSIFKKG